MINGKLEFCRDDFKMYRTLEAQFAFTRNSWQNYATTI